MDKQLFSISTPIGTARIHLETEGTRPDLSAKLHLIVGKEHTKAISKKIKNFADYTKYCHQMHSAIRLLNYMDYEELPKEDYENIMKQVYDSLENPNSPIRRRINEDDFKKVRDKSWPSLFSILTDFYAENLPVL